MLYIEKVLRKSVRRPANIHCIDQPPGVGRLIAIFQYILRVCLDRPIGMSC